MSDRNYQLSSAAIKELQKAYAETSQFPNPYRTGGYKYSIDALVKLGTNEFHPLAKVQQAFREVAGAEWYEAWASKEKRTEHGLDTDAKFILTLRVLQRTADFGLKLIQVGRRVLKSKGVTIDLQRDEDGTLLVRLNLDSAKPLKPGRATKPQASTTAKPIKPKKPRKQLKSTGKKGKTKKSRKPKTKA